MLKFSILLILGVSAFLRGSSLNEEDMKSRESWLAWKKRQIDVKLDQWERHIED